MDVQAPESLDATNEEAPATPVRTGRARRLAWDLFAVVGYVAAAFGVTAGLWRDVHGTMLAALGGSDNALFEWFLAHAAHSVTAWENPLFAYSMNTPDGVNMMANTSVLGLGIPLTPVTLAFGPLVTFKILLVFAMAGTAWGWYFVLSRHLVTSRLAALVAGAFCGFAPGMISQSIGSHLQIATQILVPFIVWRVLRLREEGRAVRNGLILGLLITYQVFIGEEILLLTALTCGVVTLTYIAMRPRAALAVWRPFLGGLGVAAGVAFALLAYPLWFQFLGPMKYHGLPFEPERYYADLASFTAYARESWFGSDATAKGLAANVTEENTFYGWPMVILVPLAVAFLWRRRLAARLTGVAIVVFFILSLGSEVIINGHDSGLNGPWALLKRIPPFDLTMSTRLSLVLIPLVGVVLALLGDRLWGPRPLAPAVEPTEAELAGKHAAPVPTAAPVRTPWRPSDLVVRVVGTLAVVVAVAPAAPTDLSIIKPQPLPAFFTSGTWKDYLPEGTTVMPAPVPYSGAMDGARWVANTRMGFATPGGYFIIPTPDGEGAQFSSTPRPLSILLRQVNRSGKVPAITEADRRSAIEDLRYWNAGLIVLAPERTNAAPLQAALTELFGPPEQVQDVVLWRTAKLTGGA
ncbi:glycosyl transferase [Luedemannella flava]|uniref:Glycosyl transferase n=1 Tax=Luedemannella flava TaxID=349316 RepID=A0ABP4YBA9_9ACTN